MARKETHNRSGNEEIVIAVGGFNSGKYGSLAKTIQEELLNVGVEVSDEMQAVFDEVGKEAAQTLRKTSPKNPKGKHSGRYAKGWVYERGKRGNGQKGAGVVRNKTDPQLTHLLEYGHPIVRDGKVVGNAEAIEHIRPVADWVAKETEKRLTKLLGGN